jgi:hypothetical protein
MKQYRVQQMATVWYEVSVEAKDEDEAQFIAEEMFNNGDGYEADGSFEFQGEFWVSE